MQTPAYTELANHAALARLLVPVLGPTRTNDALEALSIDPALAEPAGENASRAQVAMALNAALFLDLLDRVPTAARYVAQVRKHGETIVFDHGALRTIDGLTGDLPSGHAAFARFLGPLGYEVAGLYPLPALTMTGRAYVHSDLPETIPQFFVSELHVAQLPAEAQAAAEAIFDTSEDPLGEAELHVLDALEEAGQCPIADAVTIIKGALAAFGRQHCVPALADYKVLLAHSKEGAWIATEGNTFNHATARVPDVEALSEALKARGYPLKPDVDISHNGRVRQTAFLADKVLRPFRLNGRQTALEVPGSFFEFITRDPVPETGRLDLTFDSANATGIFAVTRAQR